MPEIAALIASLITDRPLCMSCLADKSGLVPDQIEAYLNRVRHIVTLRRAVDRCRACGKFTEVFSFFRRS